MRNFTSLFFSLIAFVPAMMAQAPEGYYDDIEGLTDKEIKTKLYEIINSHTALSYDKLWTAFKSTDKREDGTVWDMYSTCKFYFGNDQCGNYSNVGDCYNREHSFPKSWFNDAKPMYTDLFHLYPTDGKVNGQRSNYPFGECDGGKSLSSKALGKLGTSTFPGYSGKVFEPDDEYKGDFARSYFYMATCYEDRFSSFHSDMLAGNKYPAYKTWAINLLLKWHRQDPVSEKEINRNNEIYKNWQHNRNPFIDYPQLAEYIWGDKVGEPFTFSSSAIDENNFASVGITSEEGCIRVEADEDYTIYIYTVNGSLIEMQRNSGDAIIPVNNRGFVIVKVITSKSTFIKKLSI